jgi:hypothetical protein
MAEAKVTGLDTSLAQGHELHELQFHLHF